MRKGFQVCLFITAISLSFAKYVVEVQRVNQLQPIVSSQNEVGSPGGSIFTYNYNVAFVAEQNALLVRCQNNTSTENAYAVGPSNIAYAKILTPLNELESIIVGTIDESNVVIAPNSPETSYGTEDPRISFNPEDGNYYILYSAVANESGIPVSKLSLIVTPNPADKTTYQDIGPIFPQIKWSKSGALLIRPGELSYLYWGDSSLVSGIQLATTTDLINYNYNSSIFLPTREDYFDSALVEAGPLPLPLSDGNYLFLYNSARHGYPSVKPNWDEQYNVGWVVLDGNDPSSIVERSSMPLLSPELAWENGTFPDLGLTPNVVFCEGWTQVPNQPDSFIIFYGAADSVVGVAQISVTIS